MSTEIVTESRETRYYTGRFQRLTWLLVLLIPTLGMFLFALERDLDAASIPDYIIDREASEQIAGYAAQLGIPSSSVVLQVSAVEQLQRRAINPCPVAGGMPQVPAELAPLTPMTCEHYDDHGGVAYVAAATAVGLLGAALYLKRGNNIGLLLLTAAATDVAGGLTSAYALKGLSIEPGSLRLAHLAGTLGSITWVVLLVLLVPAILVRIPSGEVRSHRWRWLERLTYLTAALLILTQWLHPFSIGPVANPIRLSWSIEAANTLFDIGIQMWMFSIAIALIAPLMNARGWFTAKTRRRTA